MVYVLRPRKDGNGVSECSSPDELVGRGRCIHVHDEAPNKMRLSKIQRGMYEVSVNDSKMTIEAQKETMVEFFNSLSEIDEKKKRAIIEYLKNE